ncbi:hypothetical protein JTE90_018994, partial [Oedothorax gibbosus]
MGTSDNFCKDLFWDLNQTWYNQVPVFTSCFEDTILISGSCLLYSLIILISLFLLPRPYALHPLPWTWLNITKSVLCIFLLIVSIFWCGAVFHMKIKGEFVPSSTIIASIARATCFCFVGIANFQHRICRVTTSTVISTFWIVFSFASILTYRSSILTYFTLKSDTVQSTGMNFILNMVFYPIIFLQLILSGFVDRKEFIHEDNRIKEKVSLLSQVTFLWFTKIILKGRTKLLKISDLSSLSAGLKASSIYASFSEHFKYYLMPEQEKNLSLVFALIKAFWPYIVIIMVLQFICLTSLMLPPLILDRIIYFISDDYYAWRGYFYAGLMFGVDCLGKIMSNNLVYCNGVSSIQFQVAVMGALFRKNLHISTSARKEFPSGPSTLAGVGVILFLFPLTYYAKKVSTKYWDKQMTSKDLRLKLMGGILNGIKILKLYAWEIPFGAKVSEARKEEMKWIRYSFLCYAATTFVYFCAPFMVSLACFTTYLLIDETNILDPTRAFVSLTLINQLRYTLFELPACITELIQSIVSLGRLRKFFTAENKDDSLIGKNPGKDEVLTVEKASFSWSADGPCALKDISLNVSEGKLIAVIGAVGSGKSSLLSAILGEMCKKSGSVDVKGSIAYVPQQPWILNRTLKRNILLERYMHEDKYNQIVELCCLKPDLEILPGQDETEIGEKGVNLSGGQKLRVNLAQAVYQDKDVYLLDDPLSAVDVHVRKALFKDVIGNTGLLRNK